MQEIQIKKKILIADDDLSIQDIFKIILEKAGYIVQIYSDASPILENNFEFPDLFLLDRQLSGHDGLNICKRLKNQVETKDIPVIIVSATPGIRQLALEAGADGVIEKPFQMRDLLNIVSSFTHSSGVV